MVIKRDLSVLKHIRIRILNFTSTRKHFKLYTSYLYYYKVRYHEISLLTNDDDLL